VLKRSESLLLITSVSGLFERPAGPMGRTCLAPAPRNLEAEVNWSDLVLGML
jgi:hypothetical protein